MFLVAGELASRNTRLPNADTWFCHVFVLSLSIPSAVGNTSDGSQRSSEDQSSLTAGEESYMGDAFDRSSKGQRTEYTVSPRRSSTEDASSMVVEVDSLSWTGSGVALDTKEDPSGQDIIRGELAVSWLGCQPYTCNPFVQRIATAFHFSCVWRRRPRGTLPRTVPLGR